MKKKWFIAVVVVVVVLIAAHLVVHNLNPVGMLRELHGG
jgi:hypothetical protein